MRAVVCRRWCEFDELEIEDFELPALPAGGVRIAVHYASVSFATSLWVAGKYQVKPPLPFVPGTECAGVVVACAPGVTRCKPGDRVVAVLDWGGFAEEAIASELAVFPVPDALDLRRAIYLPNSYGTALAALRWRARIAPGETLLVHGAGGAVGLAAVELGKALGAGRVIATAGSDAKLEVARAHGADSTIRSDAADLAAQVKAATGGRGADVVFDPVGGDLFDASLRCIAQEGRLLTIGYASGRIPSAPANLLLVKNASVMGFNYGTYLGWGPGADRARHAPRIRANVDELFGWCVAGALDPLIGRTFPFSRYREAMASVKNRQAVGKVILAIGVDA